MTTTITITAIKRAALAALLGLSAPAFAACTWQWDCTSGQCRQIPICDNSLSIVPPKPPGIPPIVVPGVAPPRAPTLPPIGTHQCYTRYVCGSYGQCRWQDVCQ